MIPEGIPKAVARIFRGVETKTEHSSIPDRVAADMRLLGNLRAAHPGAFKGGNEGGNVGRFHAPDFRTKLEKGKPGRFGHIWT